MLVELNIVKEQSEKESQTFFNLLNISEEELESAKTELEKITMEVIASMQGDENSTLRDQGEIIGRLNQLPVEIVLLAAMVGVLEVAEKKTSEGIIDLGSLLSSLGDNSNEEEVCAECNGFPCEGVCSNEEEETKVIQLTPKTT